MKKKTFLVVAIALVLVTSSASIAQDLWNALNGPFGGSVKDIERSASGKLYIATVFGGYSSSDNGATWDRISGITNFDVRDFEINQTTGRIYAICGDNSNNYFFSDDGVNWSSSTIAGITNATRIESHPTNSAILLITSGSSLFHTSDGGLNWTNVYIFPNIITELSINSNGIVIIGCLDNSVFKGLSGGASWSPSSQVSIAGDLTRTVKSLTTFNNKFYALTTDQSPNEFDGNLWRSDNGSTWTSILSGSFTEAGLLYTGKINFNVAGALMLAIDDDFWVSDDPTVASPVWIRKGDVGSWGLTKVIAGSGDEIFATSSTHTVVKSTDGGVTWEQSVSGITSVAPQDILETADGRLLFADDVGFYLSLDQGQNWQTNKNPPNGSLEYFRKLVELDDASILMLSGYGARKYEGSDVLVDVGPTPEWMPNFAFSRTTTPGNYITIGASSGQNIYRSTDGAANWSLESYTGLPGSFLVQQIEIEDQSKYSNQGYLFLRLSTNQLYRIKQGTTTAELVTVPSGSLLDVKILDAFNKDVLYILQQSGANYRISYSKDHGDTWTTVTPSVLTSSNARSLSVLTDNSVEYKDENMLSVFADGGKIFISYDNGATWVNETYSAPRALFKKIIRTDENYGYLIGQGVRARRSSRPLFKPAMPQNFRVESYTFNRAVLKWEDNSSLEDVFVLEKSVGTNTGYQVETEAVTNASQIQLTNLIPNTTYFFRLAAKGPGGQSPYTNEVSFTTLDNSCALSIPVNKNWTSIVQKTRGPQFATLSPTTHIDPDQSYVLTFDVTGTELQGSVKVYAHGGVIVNDINDPVDNDPRAPWQYVKGNFGSDDGIGEMTNVGGNLWELQLNSTLRNYFGVPGGTPIYWVAFVFRNADGSVTASNNGVAQDTFISVEKGFIDGEVGIDIADPSTNRYSATAAPGYFFEACNVISTTFAGIGSWNNVTNTIYFNWTTTDQPFGKKYDQHWTNISTLNADYPATIGEPTVEVFQATPTSNLIRWTRVDFATKYRIEKTTDFCVSDLAGTYNYSTTNLNGGSCSNAPGPVTGSGTITSVGEGIYTLSDNCFGLNLACFGDPAPCGGSLKWNHSCSSLTWTGMDQFGASYIIVPSSITDTQLTFSWSDTNSESAVTVLTRTDGKSWLGLTQPTPSFSLVAEVDYPATSFIEEGISFGEKGIYRVRAENSSAVSEFSSSTTYEIIDPLFVPLFNELNQINYVGQGVSATDLNNDGADDIILATFLNSFNEGDIPKVFRNNADNTFTLVNIPGMEIENVGTNRSSITADFNDDGFPDLLFPRTNNGVDDNVLKNVLLLNQGNFSFNKTKIVTNPGYSNQFAAVVAFDFNSDGNLDLFKVSNNGPNLDGKFGAQPNFLWKNLGPASFIEEKTAGTITTDLIAGIDASTADYDNDGDLDLFVLERITNSVVVQTANRLYRNNGDNTFSRVNGLVFDIDLSRGWRSSSWGDIDNDGDLDLFAGSSSGNGPWYLYRNNGDGTFTNLLTSAVTTYNSSCFGSAFGDLDNDGDIDLVIPGFVTGGNAIYINDGTGEFLRYNSIEAFNSPYQANVGIALADFDNDGFLDLAPAPEEGLPLTIFHNTAKGAAGNKWIKFKLNGTTSNKSAIAARIKVTTGAKNQIREISARTGYGSQSSLTQHFGLGSASVVDQVQITWPSGNVMTLNNLAANQLYEIDEDLTGPTLVSISPTNGGAGVAIDANLVITFNEPPAGVAGKNVKVFKSDNLTTPIATVDAGTGVVTGNAIEFTLPAPLELFTNYSVVVDDGAITDRFQNVAENVTTWSFQTADNTPPQVSFTEVPLVNKGFASTTFTLTATDNSDVSSVVMTYRGMTSKTSGTLNGTKNGNEWSFTVAENIFDAMGLEYFFTAKDPTNNETRSPADDTQYYRTRFSLPTGAEPTLSMVGSNGNVTGYRIISIPYELSNSGISENFEELGGGDPKQFRFIRYHETPTPGWDLYPGSLNNLSIGEGYFINVRNAITITLKDAVTPDFNRASLFAMNLKKGWNQIGNPYTTQIVWSDVLAYNGSPAGVSNVSKFNGQYFIDPNGAIDPFEGGFVQVENDITLQIPFKGFTTGGRRRSVIENAELDQPSWIAALTLQQSGLTYSLGSVGMDPTAATGKDIFDLVTPPGLSEYAEINFAHPEHFMKRFTRDVVPTQKEYQWEFTVDTNISGHAELLWNSEAFGNGVKELALFDITQQRLIDMKQESSYQFDPSKSSRFRVYFGEQLKEKILPESITLGEPYPNPSNAISTVSFTLPESGSHYNVRLEVYDNVGRSVHVIVDEGRKAGFYTEHWNAANHPNGLYSYRLIVNSADGSKIETKKAIINK